MQDRDLRLTESHRPRLTHTSASVWEHDLPGTRRCRRQDQQFSRLSSSSILFSERRPVAQAGRPMPEAPLEAHCTTSDVVEQSTVQMLTSRTLLPPKRHKRRSNLLQPPLRRQHIILRRRIPRILHLHPNPQLRQIPPRRRTQRRNARPRAQDQKIRLRPHDLQRAPRHPITLPLPLRVQQFPAGARDALVVVARGARTQCSLLAPRAHPRPPLEGFAADEQRAGARDAQPAVEREAVRQADVDGRRGRGRVGEDVEGVEVGLRVFFAGRAAVFALGGGEGAGGGVEGVVCLSARVARRGIEVVIVFILTPNLCVIPVLRDDSLFDFAVISESECLSPAVSSKKCPSPKRHARPQADRRRLSRRAAFKRHTTNLQPLRGCVRTSTHNL
ncbi:hypothetical protein L1887_63474 [Cichorium endivia]|nr:hypothetical protein L1887_63474 [Cichorium endivia]